MNGIKKSLLVTFDFSQRGKSGTGLAASSLISACKNHNSYGIKFSISHLPIRMPDEGTNKLSAIAVYQKIINEVELSNLDSLVLACYIWSSDLVNPLIELLRNSGFSGKVILGGYQIHEKTCRELYPEGDIYLPGDAEVSLPEAILMDRPIVSKVLEMKVDFESLASPFLDGSYQIEQGAEMLHWETSRGCTFKCNFCAHRDLIGQGVHPRGIDKIKREMDLFKRKEVRKINVLDPVLNYGTKYKEILRYAIEIELKSLLSLQVRFEMVDEEFLKLCSQLNVELEFGLQTIVKEEYVAIERPNNLKIVEKNIELINKSGLLYEVSIIYGLPNQTFESFNGTVNYLLNRRVPIIKAFPLMLLQGTKLIDQKEQFGLVEEVIDGSGIPHVVASNSFTKGEWKKMDQLAKSLPMKNKKEAA